jgi:mRNA interferase MazF
VTSPYLRGEVVSIADGKPRPAVVVRADAFSARNRVVVAAFTTVDLGAELFRVAIEPSENNGLEKRSFVMADFLVTVRQERIGGRIGRLSDSDMLRINTALAVYLGIEGTSTR